LALPPLRDLGVFRRRVVALRARAPGEVGRRAKPRAVTGQAIHDAEHDLVALAFAGGARFVEAAILRARIERHRMAAHARPIVARGDGVLGLLPPRLLFWMTIAAPAIFGQEIVAAGPDEEVVAALLLEHDVSAPNVGPEVGRARRGVDQLRLGALG